MNRIENLFKQTKPYIGFVTVGHGGIERSFEMACAFVDGGADIMEISVPFSDPTADGPVIQAAMQDALSHHVTLNDVLDFAKRLRAKYPELPLVLFGYYNIFFQALSKGFFEKIKAAGFDAVLVVDLPLEEDEEFYKHCLEHELNQILLVTPATDDARLKDIAKKANGFLYYVCQKGTTGARDQMPTDFAKNIQRIKQATPAPVIAGFGISNREMAAQVLEQADGFVVASKVVAAMQEGKNASDIQQLVQSINPKTES